MFATVNDGHHPMNSDRLERVDAQLSLFRRNLAVKVLRS